MGRRVIRKAGHAAVIDDEDSIFGHLLFSLKHGGETNAVKSGLFLGLDFAKIEQCGQNVLYLREATDVARFPKLSFGPANETRHAVPTLPDLGFLPPHPGIEILGAKQATVVRLEDQNGVLDQALIVKKLNQLTHVPIDIANHS